MGFQTTGNKILVRRDATKTVSGGGIIIPDSAQEKQTTGVVVNVGAAVREIAVGHRVMFGQFAGKEIEIDGEKLSVMVDAEIIGFYSDGAHQGGKPHLAPVEG